MQGTLKEKKMTEAEYRSKNIYSSSSLRLFVDSRKDFYKREVLGEPRKDKTNKSILYGSATHAKLLEPELFDSQYKLSTLKSVPSGNMILFVDALVEARLANTNEDGELTVEFSQLVEEAYETSGYKISVDAVLKKFSAKHKVTEESPEDYFKEVLEAKFNGITIITLQDMAIIEKICEIVTEDQFIGHLFEDGINELKIDDFELLGVPLKLMIDKITISREDKTIQPYDLKCLYDNQNFKRDYYLKRQGWVQALIYTEGLQDFIKRGMLGNDFKEYTVLPISYICVDTSCFYAPVRYDLSSKDIKDAFVGWEENGRKYIGVKDILEELSWCTETGIWNMSKSVYENGGKTEL